MPHISREELLRASEAGRAEIERLAPHLSVCLSCRALAAGFLEDSAIPATREVPFKIFLGLATFERETAIGHLLARAEWAGLRKLTKGAQKDRVIRSRPCHTRAFLDVLLADLRAPHSREESDYLASLAVLAAQGMDSKGDSAASKNDLLAGVWIDTANARRMNGDWYHAQAALLRAEHYRESGTGAPYLRARWLSITASLRVDQGARDEAMTHLEQCRSIYESRNDWPFVARTLVKMAHCLVDDDPERGLDLLDKARIFIPSGDAGLQWLAESNRAECLIWLRRVDEALVAFEEAERLRQLHYRPSAKLRSTFTAARLLEALGHMREAEVLFDEVVTGDLEKGLYKDALLDLLYVFGFHVRQGRPERAAEVSLHVLGEMERESSAVHEQLRLVWTQLIEAAQGKVLDEGILAEAHDYLQAHWKHPAPTVPTFGQKVRTSSLSGRIPLLENERLIEPLLARALWSLIRRETRREQQARVAAAHECHTTAFLDVLLVNVSGAAGSRDESEFIGSLALTVAQSVDETDAVKHDLQARVWTEIANARRVGAEWSRSMAALGRAEEHLAQGSGDLLLKARARSVAASLRADQGHRSEAVVVLAECQKIYEDLKAWPLVARTLVKMAHVLVDTDPTRGLTLTEKALPLIPVSDSVLRWLAESNRTECLIQMGEIGQALQAFHLAESLRAGYPRADADRRSSFTAGRLLEGLGRIKEAAQLFGDVIAEAFEHEAYREAFLDLLYLAGIHIRTGATEKAVALCQFAITQLELFGIGHEQIRGVWVGLMEAAKRQAVTLESLAEVRGFLEMHWKHPAAKAPSFSFRPRGTLE